MRRIAGATAVLNLAGDRPLRPQGRHPASSGLWARRPTPTTTSFDMTQPQNLVGSEAWLWTRMGFVGWPGCPKRRGVQAPTRRIPWMKRRAPGRSELPDLFIVVLVMAGRP